MPVKGIHVERDFMNTEDTDWLLWKDNMIMQHIIDAIPDLVWLKSIDGVYMSCNKRFEQFFGAKKDEIVGKTDYDFVEKDLADFFRHNDMMAVELGRPRTNEETLKFNVDGHTEIVETIKTPIYNDQQSPIAILGIARDITMRKTAENALKEMNSLLEEKVEERTEDLKQAKELAEQANEAKTSFIAHMSHEIRTPINAIIGMNYLMGLTELNKTQKDYTDKIGASSEQLRGIVSDILDFSKIEARQTELELIDFNIKKIINNVISLHQEHAFEKGLSFKGFIDKKIPDYLIGDPLRVGQIIGNLVSNAIKFTNEGGVELTATMKQEVDGRNEVIISVKDTGIGLTQCHKDKIFNAFQQADSSISRLYGGTGLGLVICKELVKMMGGTILVESEYQVGSEFKVIIPFSKSPKVDQTIEDYYELPRLDCHQPIMVVEDNELNQQLIKEIIEERGGKVLLVNNGEAAVQMLQDGCIPGMILMDVHMPVMDGVEATSRIRAIEIVDSIPIVGLSADATVDTKRRLIEAGMDDYIAKPIQVEGMIKTIKHWLK